MNSENHTAWRDTRLPTTEFRKTKNVLVQQSHQEMREEPDPLVMELVDFLEVWDPINFGRAWQRLR